MSKRDELMERWNVLQVEIQEKQMEQFVIATELGIDFETWQAS